LKTPLKEFIDLNKLKWCSWCPYLKMVSLSLLTRIPVNTMLIVRAQMLHVQSTLYLFNATLCYVINPISFPRTRITHFNLYDPYCYQCSVLFLVVNR
jgi:hypothetical protein